MRDEKTFGKDVKVFRPERWLDDGSGRGVNTDGTSIGEMEKGLDLAFGFGKWGCLGEIVVKMELDKLLFEVSLSFPPFLECSSILQLLS